MSKFIGNFSIFDLDKIHVNRKNSSNYNQEVRIEIVPSEDENCITKILPLKECQFILSMMFYAPQKEWTGSFLGGYKTTPARVETGLIVSNYKHSIEYSVSITVPKGTEIRGLIDHEVEKYSVKYSYSTPRSDQEYIHSYRPQISLKNSGVKMKLDLNKYQSSYYSFFTSNLSLVEENGKFHYQIMNVNFDPKTWKNSTEYSEDRTPKSEKNSLSDLWQKVFRDIQKVQFKEIADLNRFFRFLGSDSLAEDLPKGQGVTKTLEKVKGFYTKSCKENPINSLAFLYLVKNSHRVLDKVKISVAFNSMYGEIKTQEDFDELGNFLGNLLFEKRTSYGVEDHFLTDMLNKQTQAREVKKSAIKRTATGSFNKIMNDMDFVNIDEVLFPLTSKAVNEGEIPLGTFFRKDGDQYMMYNDNWQLWEEMLTQFPEIALELAKSVSGRTTYEKDLMSYFFFTLHELPEYLESQTGRKWKGIPKLVNSSDELEPPKEGQNGITKTRSALTPIPDNENATITVPYVSMQIYGGYGTSYCYGLTYSVLKRGFSKDGNTVTADVEKALNGKDDYGLMFYTLTGSAAAQGYPTFLIIFEKLLTDETKVHFHRTHPMRSKNGEYSSVHNWTKGCYKWMIGNVNYERIVTQQGDLAFVKIDDDNWNGHPDVTEVEQYDSHCFEVPVKYLPYTKGKENILGYVQLDHDTVLIHKEHLNRLIPKGTYEIRQCRSWEANPKGIWSLRID